MPTLSGRYASMDKSDLGMDWARQGLNVAQQLLAQKSGKYTHKKSDLSKRERYGIDFAKQSYTAPGDRVKKLHGYTLVDKYSSEKYAVYERKGKYQVAVRGTVPGHKLTEKSGDILQDMEILKGNGPQIQVNEAKALIQQIITDNPGAKGNIGLNSHSLGARINLELLHDNPENFSDSVSLAPGMSPLGSKEDQEHMKALVQDNTEVPAAYKVTRVHSVNKDVHSHVFYVVNPVQTQVVVGYAPSRTRDIWKLFRQRHGRDFVKKRRARYHSRILGLVGSQVGVKQVHCCTDPEVISAIYANANLDLEDLVGLDLRIENIWG